LVDPKLIDKVMQAYLEDVFKKSGIPTYTFVKPNEYNRILVALRTKGRGVIVEGPSGIGKTTTIQKVIDELHLNKKVLKLSARKRDDVELIQIVTGSKDNGTIIIDDFHVLPLAIKSELADFMKILADEERENDKLILIGINKAGDSLIKLANDLNNRVDTIRLAKNSDEKIVELIEKGEQAPNITLTTKDAIVALSKGSFHIAQYLCNEVCTNDGVLENSTEARSVDISIEVIKEKVIDEFSRNFYRKAKAFAVGNKLKREGRAPYLHLLYWLSISDDWTIQIDDILRAYPELKLSISQVVDKGFLENLIQNNVDIQDVINYDSSSRILTIEDPKFMFYIQNMLWSKFARQVGFISILFNNKYDFALSFAGENRDLASRINALLLEADIAVFYDKNEQSRILAESVEDYLAPIYNSEAKFIVPLLSSIYPRKIWTKFESDSFRERFGKNSIIPIWYSDCPTSMFDESRKYGGITFDIGQNIEDQARIICEVLIQKIAEYRNSEKDLENDD